MDRTPYDGEPYYCDTCGLGILEIKDCGDVDCRMESEPSARYRKNKKRNLASDLEIVRANNKDAE